MRWFDGITNWMDRETWRAAVHEFAKSQTLLSDFLSHSEMKKANNIQKSALKPQAATGQCDMLISLVLKSFSLFSTLVFSLALSICVGFFSFSF